MCFPFDLCISCVTRGPERKHLFSMIDVISALHFTEQNVQPHKESKLKMTLSDRGKQGSDVLGAGDCPPPA